jgi:superoxide reductase
MTLEFYKCLHCGNVAIKVYDKKPPLSCCGEKMAKLEANTTDAAQEKHVPVVTVEGDVVKAVVGSVAHPMTEEHLIAFIVLETKKGYQVANLSAGETPEATFAVAQGDVPVAVYEYCNLHGLWKAEI